jgi:hypothetical protein
MPAASSQHTTIAATKSATPDAIVATYVGGSQVPVEADAVDDGLSSGVVTPADDAMNVAAADSYTGPALDEPGPVLSDDQVRAMSADATSGAIYYGTVYDSMSSNGLANATLTLGQIPDSLTCNASQSCGKPAGKLYKVTTNSKGAFAFPTIPAGPYMLVISKNAAYANLHAMVNLRSGHYRTGLRLLALSSDETKWLAQVNQQRVTIPSPKSFSIAVDQYAEIEARAWAADVARGKTQYSDSGYGPYQTAYTKSAGSLYGASGVLDLQYGTSQYSGADQAWMGEKANCPHGDWQTCPFAGNTGHYINLSNTQDVWVGVGETTGVESGAMAWPGYSPYDIMTVMNVQTPGPA